LNSTSDSRDIHPSVSKIASLSKSGEREEDPLLRNARFEAFLVLATWITAAVYSVTYCRLYGYLPENQELKFTFGFPSWIFFGVVIPWLSCALVSLVISLFVMKGDSLGAESDDSLLSEDSDVL
jgi:hypothetical protein